MCCSRAEALGKLCPQWWQLDAFHIHDGFGADDKTLSGATSLAWVGAGDRGDRGGGGVPAAALLVSPEG